MSNIAIYIHWPFCLAKCPYCDFNSHVRDKIDENKWQQSYLTEIDYFSNELENRTISSIFFGGGTPSLMPTKIVAEIIKHLQKKAVFTKDIEITIEANPTSIEASKFDEFAKAGINRVSVGIQALNDKDLKFLGRTHNASEALKALEIAKSNFKNFSFDLIYARPNQTLQQWQQELRSAMQFAGNHLSLYQLTIEKGTKFYSAYNNNEFVMPDEQLATKLYQLTRDICLDYGLIDYEISNYAIPGFESKHNLAYWNYQDYLGIGPGAHSRVNKQAIMMIHNPENWLQAVAKQGNGIQTRTKLTTEEIIQEFTLMGLRINTGIDINKLAAIMHKDRETIYNHEKLDLLVKQKLVSKTPTHIIATDQGRLVLNQIINFLLS